MILLRTGFFPVSRLIAPITAALMCLLSTSASAGDVMDINQSLNWTGTLVFGAGNRLEPDDAYRANLFHHYYGAVTFKRHLGNDFSPRLNSFAGNRTRIDSLVGKVGELPSASANASSGKQRTYLGTSSGAITPMQIALGEQSTFIGEEITATPEPPTWFAAVLVACAVAWSQRRRLARSFSTF